MKFLIPISAVAAATCIWLLDGGSSPRPEPVVDAPLAAAAARVPAANMPLSRPAPAATAAGGPVAASSAATANMRTTPQYTQTQYGEPMTIMPDGTVIIQRNVTVMQTRDGTRREIPATITARPIQKPKQIMRHPLKPDDGTVAGSPAPDAAGPAASPHH